MSINSAHSAKHLLSEDFLLLRDGSCINCAKQCLYHVENHLGKHIKLFDDSPGYEHQLKLDEAQPFWVKSHPILQKYIAQAKLENKQMFKDEIIKRSESNLINPAVIIAKNCLDTKTASNFELIN